ncbi:hypothetical protein RDI58_002721 [Solanum bulbocastanum]|uniref:Uncharacterized protein n=1 Tax=Solanum bulbocastanum TaxID=147425 RepID=A0AAN8U4N2_SOLBU
MIIVSVKIWRWRYYKGYRCCDSNARARVGSLINNSHMFIGKQFNYHESNNQLKMLIHSHDDIPRVDIISNSEGTSVIENDDHLSSFLANTYHMVGHLSS